MRTAILMLAALPAAFSQGISFPGPGMPASSGGGGGIYLHHRALTIDHTKAGGATLTNFPVLVSLTLGAGKIQNVNCYDVILTSDSGGASKVAWDPEANICNSATGTFTAWVLIPSISSSVDTVFYVFYDNVAIGAPQNTGSLAPANVWSAPGYLGVFHLPNGTVLTANDSTSNGFNGTLGPATHAPSATAGETGGGALFAAASTQYFTIPNTLSPYGTKTLSFWYQPATQTATQVLLGLDGNTFGTFDAFAVWSSGGTVGAVAQNSNISGQQALGTFSNGSWYYIAIAKTAGQINKIYVNGSDVTTANVTGYVGTSYATNMVGVFNDLSSFPSNAALDEIRLFDGTLTPAWIAAEYNNQKPASTFLTVGGEI